METIPDIRYEVADDEDDKTIGDLVAWLSKLPQDARLTWTPHCVGEPLVFEFSTGERDDEDDPQLWVCEKIW